MQKSTYQHSVGCCLAALAAQGQAGPQAASPTAPRLMQVHLSSVPGTGLHDPYAILVLLLFCIGELWPQPAFLVAVLCADEDRRCPSRYLLVHPVLCVALCGGE